MEFKARIGYEDIWEALDLQIIESGLSQKEIAAHIYPGRRIETAKSLFSRAKNPENTDANLTVEQLIAIMDLIGGDNIVYCLCERYFFQRPEKRDPQAAALDREASINGLLEQFEAMGSRLKQLAKVEK